VAARAGVVLMGGGPLFAGSFCGISGMVGPAHPSELLDSVPATEP